MSEDYKAKYEEALEKARVIYKGRKTMHYTDEVSDLEFLFPELAETYDEMMIEAIIDALNSHCNSINHLSARGYQMEDVKAWLEKRKEIPNDRSGLNDFEIRLMDCMLSAQQYRQGSIDLGIVKPWAEELSELIEQPNKKWSEKDERILSDIRHLLFDHAFENDGVDVNGDYCKDVYQEADDFLNSLRPHWKPSEEQLNELHYALVPGYAYNGDVLQGLYADLKKLMEE